MASENRTAIAATGYAHIRLTVTDIARSRAFYDSVFAFPVAFEMPADADDATREALSFLYNGSSIRSAAASSACARSHRRATASAKTASDSTT
jgi:catechol 2,3-dioxygenase-like lactoylglutathione lyase family enzyme